MQKLPEKEAENYNSVPACQASFNKTNDAWQTHNAKLFTHIWPATRAKVNSKSM